MSQIKNIIFDLGGVLLNLDYNKTSVAFQKLGVANFDDLFTQFKANTLFEDLETGKISNESFYETIQQYCRPGVTRQEMESAWNAMLLDYREESLIYLTQLKQRYNLFLLSNTNRIHLAAIQALFTSQMGEKPLLDDYFTKAYYSHIIQMRKPYVSTYEFVLQDGNMLASETLFIEDSIQNVEGAKELGIQTLLLLPAEKIENLGL